MHIVAITFGDQQAASTRYRIGQFKPFFHEEGITIECIPQQGFKDASCLTKADIVINQKCLLPGSLSKEIVAASKRLIFDFDDAIYTRPEKPYSWLTQWRIDRRLKFWMTHADCVIAANGHLRQYANKLASKVEVVPMSLDLTQWKPANQKKDTVRIGWAGAPSNLHHLESLEPQLMRLLESNPQAQLAIYCGKRPNLKCSFEHVPYSPDTEPSFIQTLDIGLLPLKNEEFSKGKSPIKAIQYLACGVPVVGHIVGATEDILNPQNSLGVSRNEEWITHIQTLIDQPVLRAQLGNAGRNHILQHHCLKHNGKRLLEIFSCLTI